MQQATCVHSGADTVTSPGNDEISAAPSRRSLLGFAGLGAIAFAAPIGAAAPQTSRWDMIRDRWERADNEAAMFNDGEYETARCQLEQKQGTKPPHYFELTSKDGKTSRFPIDARKSTAVYLSPVVEKLHSDAVNAWNDWFNRGTALEAQPWWRVVDDRMEALHEAADQARIALMEEPAPHAAALALKVQLMLGNDEIWDSDRVCVMADAARLSKSS